MPLFAVPRRSRINRFVDMQNDFMPGGALAVAGGDEIIDGVNASPGCFFDCWGMVVLSKIGIPVSHASFASIVSWQARL